MKNPNKLPISEYIEAPFQGDPEHQICAAVLTRAILDAFGIGQVSSQERRQAKHWLCLYRSIPKRPSVMSFGWICESLNLNPEEIKKHLIADSRIAIKILKLDRRNYSWGK